MCHCSFNRGTADSLGCVKVHSMDKEDGTDSSWKELGQTLRVMSNGDNFGFSISLSNNGNSLAIGAVGGNYAQVYSIDEGDEPNWLLLGRRSNEKPLMMCLDSACRCPEMAISWLLELLTIPMVQAM